MKQFYQFLLATLLFLITGLSFADGISIEAPYVREVPPGVPTSASFLNIKNASATEISLIKATSDVAKNVELHEHVHKDGMMEMRQVPKISIPANGTRELKPGGYHIMLIGLTRKIKSGDMIDISLEFDDGSKHAIRAEVKKVMQGMMMKKKMADIKLQSHVNPMPDFMRVYKKMAGKLNLNADQVSKLDAGIKEREPKIKELTTLVAKIEADIQKAALNGDSLEEIDQLANNLMQERLAIINEKTYCRETAKDILDEEQFKNLVKLYRANFMPKSNMDKKKAEMAMKTHTNPMPDLMMVVNKMPETLELSETQAADLGQWNKERGPVVARQYKSVTALETKLLEAALNNESTDKLAPLADGIMQVRMKIIRGKALSRDNMRRILDNKQYAKVIALYKANFMNHK